VAPVISLRDITKSYGTGAARTQVLRGVSLDIEPGELVALVGQSGSGKSTLLNIVGGLDKADGGDVTVLDHNYQRTPERELARLRNTSIGFVFQAFNLLDHLTCLDNVTLSAAFAAGGKDAPNRGREALDRVGLSAVRRAGSRRSCRVGRSSGSPSRARCSAGPSCSCATSPPATSTRPPAPRSSSSSRSSTRTTA
jgi:ABC-type lipoprotein export system ATPase subunit